MHFKKFLTYLIVTLFALNFLNASDELHGADLTNAIEKNLKQNSYTPFFQELTQTGLDEFAGNLLFDIKPQSQKLEAKDDSENAFQKEKTRTTLVLAISQETFLKNEDDFLNFFEQIRSSNALCAVSVVLTALDEPFFENYFKRTGTNTYVSSVDDPDDIFAVLIDFANENSRQKKSSIKNSGKHATSPLWLSKLTEEAFLAQKISFTSETIFSSLYRLGFIQGDKKLSLFLDSGIPAVKLSLTSASELSAIVTIAENYHPDISTDWDRHYILFSFPKIQKTFSLTEKSLLRLCIAAEIFVILILCSFSFLGEYGDLYKKQLIHSLYLIPLTLSVTFISFVIGQKCTALIATAIEMTPVMQYALKLFFSMIFITVLFGLQETLHIPIAAVVYSYMISIVAMFNIFLFSMCDILLFLTFLAEYLIIYFSRSAKRIPSLIILFLMMGVPFAPYAYAIASKAENDILHELVMAGVLENIFLTFIIFPFQIIWLRILVRFNVYAKKADTSLKRIFRNGAISLGAISIFIFLTLAAISNFIYRPLDRTEKNQEKIYFEEDHGTLSVSLAQDSFLGMSTNHITIQSKKKAIRYNVSVFGLNNEMPVYDSIYEYDVEPLNLQKKIKAFENVDAVTFLIPDYPPEKITVDYASYTKSDIYVFITAIYPSDKINLYRTEVRLLKNEAE